MPVGRAKILSDNWSRLHVDCLSGPQLLVALSAKGNGLQLNDSTRFSRVVAAPLLNQRSTSTRSTQLSLVIPCPRNTLTKRRRNHIVCLDRSLEASSFSFHLFLRTLCASCSM